MGGDAREHAAALCAARSVPHRSAFDTLSNGRAIVRARLAALALGALVGAGCTASVAPSVIGEAVGALGRASLAADRAATGAAVARVVDDATHALARALPDADDRGASLLREAFLGAVRSGNFEAAARLRAHWIVPADDLEAATVSIEWALVQGDFDAARTQAWAAAERFEGARTQLLTLWYRGWAADPDFVAPVETIEAGSGTFDGLENLSGGSSINFRALRGGRVIGAFKPNQSRLQTSYRGELAAYRLCALIHCGFVVPRNREVRIERSQLMALAGRTRPSEVRAFERQYRDLVWFEDEAGRSWLHGTLKDWVPDFRQFAIEQRDVWRPLVRLSGPPPGEARLESLMQRALTTARYGNPGPASSLGRLDGPGLGRQLSNLHVFDFLLNNWDRYSSEYWGVNCQWFVDRFVSIDNGAAFPPLENHGVFSSRPLNNLQQVQRFSRRTIDAIRWMDPEAVYPILFPPSPDHDERADFEAFLVRRQWLLDYVDGLIAEHGEEAVLVFR